MYYTKESLPKELAVEQLWSISEAAYDHGSPWSVNQFKSDLDQKTSNYLVLAEEQWIGFISYQLVLDEAELTHVVIHKKFQHQGCGSQLIDQVIQRLRKQGVTQLFLEVRESNVSAKNLYEKKGFKIINRRKNYYRLPSEDGIVMCLKLKEVKQ
ncbi:ribosomal protein S18-alanine N-acetyltransferase [Enterococcus caccae]|uniref:[Ribosomal protein bS18]-alanine N-acetyltransferase n=1 Tax=Enterococcus caccae ATCC BAA-1240 TaxID=1158612 RepID=R3TQG0_9ENTE|nr:ribosomal protein S18-alanine N-acetyltransferase [Enterococcus caccae]EOL43333.1 ribosomal-protein-alanine acetyltransferase [Enterococcus caccae ATCC BAA-1240]EOT68267.1 ribosomal-protein-alanine acetyltransferase [Enterococcus caccae ATCC BAA-1240]OJG26754.1 ribosomal-protein-alanine acetyltransferase [Enterococcus caccae]